MKQSFHLAKVFSGLLTSALEPVSRSLDVGGRAREPSRVELVYLLAPDSEKQASGQSGFELLIGQRPLRGSHAG